MSEARALSLLKQGIANARAGEKALARRLLKRSAELNPHTDAVWLWLAVVAESPQTKIEYLQRALAANPKNQRVHAMLKQLQTKYTKRSQGWKCPLCMARADEPQNPCQRCGAVLNLEDLDAVLEANIDRPKIQRAINGYKSVLGQGVDFGAHYNLAVAHLNLRQIDHAIAHLQSAIRLNPGDESIKEATAELVRRQAAAQAASAMNGANGAQQMRGLILAVDDSPTIRKLVNMTLTRHEYDVVLAEDGMEALGKLNNIEPDLILLDITMPRMDGYQVCKIIKSNQETRHIPVVMLSGKDGFFDKVRGRLAGSTHYITKPFDPSMLLQIVERYALQYEESG